MHVLATIIGIGWIIFWLYWIISAFGSKQAAHSSVKQFVAMRSITLPLAVVLVVTFNHLPNSLKDHYRAFNTNQLVLVLGLVIFLIGLLTAVAARVYLGKNWGMPMTQKKDPELVTAGPYNLIRHPIYTGILLMAFGSFFDVNIYWLIVFIIAAGVFIYSAIAEERLMVKQFPKDYPAYKAKTKMLIPFVF